MWVLAGLGAFGLGRLVRTGRRPAWTVEGVAAVFAGVIAGMVATALDFGGWREPDWRAALFALLIAWTAVAIVRFVGLLLARRER